MDRSTTFTQAPVDFWQRFAEYTQTLRVLTDAGSVLQRAADMIADAGLFRRVVLSLHDNDGNLGPIGYHGLPKELIDQARRAPRVRKEVREAILKEEFRIGESYFVPAEAGINLSGEDRHIPSSANGAEGSWQPGDELFTPLREDDRNVIGFCSVDEPHDGHRPTPQTLHLLEAIVNAAAIRVITLSLKHSLEQQTERLARVLQHTGDVVYDIDVETKTFVSFSDSVSDLTGVTADALASLPFTEWLRRFVHPEDRDRVRLGPDDADPIDEEQGDWALVSEYRVVHADGSVRWVRDRSSAIVDDDGQLVGFEGVLQDITAWHVAADELKSVERQYRVIADNVRDLVYMHDQSGNIFYVSPSVERYLGVTPDEALGTHFSDWLTDNPINSKAFEVFDTEIHAGHQVEPFLLELRARDGQTFFMEFNDSLILDEKGTVVGVQGVGRDVTERERVLEQVVESRKRLDAANAALKSLVNQSRRRQSHTTELNRRLEQKNEELESFLHIVAHDLRSPLINLRGLAAQLRRRYANRLDERGHETIQRLGSEAARLSKLIGDVMTFAMAGADLTARRQVDLGLMLEVVWTRLEDMGLAANASLTRAQEPCLVWADPTALERVLENLLVNALTHCPAERSPEVHVGWEISPDTVMIHVSDNGLGITPEDLPHVFELFYRGRNVNADGSGLGLAIVKRIVEASQGEIMCTPSRRHGTTFSITWPRLDAHTRPDHADSPDS